MSYVERIYSNSEIEKQRELVKQKELDYADYDPETRNTQIKKDLERLEFVQEGIKRLKNQILQTQQQLAEVKNKKTNMFNRAKQQKEIMMLQEKLANEQNNLYRQEAYEERMLGR